MTTSQNRQFFYPLLSLDVFFTCPGLTARVQIYTGLIQFSVSKLFGHGSKVRLREVLLVNNLEIEETKTSHLDSIQLLKLKE